MQARGALHQEPSPEQVERDRQDLDEQFTALGIVLLPADDEPASEAPGDFFYLLPENLPTWNLWQRLQTQWRHGIDGPTGLDFSGVLCVMEANGGAGPRRRRRLLPVIDAMQRAALDEFAKQRDRNRTTRQH